VLPEFGLEGKTALVTGGGRGIGRAIALCLAEAGADVAVVARKPDQIASTAGELEGFGRRALALTGDVRKQDDVTAVVEAAIDGFGKLDIVVNAAGTALMRPIVYHEGMRFAGWQATLDGHNNSAWDQGTRDEDWDLILDTNVRSVLNMARAVGPHMLARGSGRMVNVVSCYYDVAPPYHAAYSTSKAAVRMLTRCISTEWAPFGVVVNGIAPGNVTTDLNTTALQDDEMLEWLELVPLKRPAAPREIGMLAVYLSSDASRYMTGETVVIDGGELSRGNGL
jgi:NAD(P)-dependent dehydrogenase (short-subunit alcohol dehydrogenase family)